LGVRANTGQSQRGLRTHHLIGVAKLFNQHRHGIAGFGPDAAQDGGRPAPHGRVFRLQRLQEHRHRRALAVFQLVERRDVGLGVAEVAGPVAGRLAVEECLAADMTEDDVPERRQEQRCHQGAKHQDGDEGHPVLGHDAPRARGALASEVDVSNGVTHGGVRMNRQPTFQPSVIAVQCFTSTMAQTVESGTSIGRTLRIRPTRTSCSTRRPRPETEQSTSLPDQRSEATSASVM
jgi:hypothetical protein